ncbi:hypothetical protein UPYG_G00288960 [Umbra pygmaea]|uniref:Uncharacterized protein n=1 Tax=Umbra pygmaea TaxID=75934 RepID=A0ABD0WQP4_UMBPY
MCSLSLKSLLDLGCRHLHHKKTFQEAPSCTTERWGVISAILGLLSLLDIGPSSHLHYKKTFQEAPSCTMERWGGGIHLMQSTDTPSLYQILLSVTPIIIFNPYLMLNMQEVGCSKHLNNQALGQHHHSKLMPH